ncbi:methyltransferase domain-containing protein [bacterium]|nr:methyltransferase domain-containing protein [bacterium]
MPKKIAFESARTLFLMAARQIVESEQILKSDSCAQWEKFIQSLEFDYAGDGVVNVKWSVPAAGESRFTIDRAMLHRRGDDVNANQIQAPVDEIKQANSRHYLEAVLKIAGEAGIRPSAANHAVASMSGGTDISTDLEEAFHDEWANTEDPKSIDVRLMNEANTAPEMRHIRQRLGDLKGKTLLDVGCGLGEAGVYFAMEGADVTVTDLSQKMLDAAAELGKCNGVTVKTHKASAESLNLPPDRKFDIIYAGNLLHHVQIDKTLETLIPHLAEGGVFVSWDPVQYNPIINVYRMMATKVRTPGEHPLRLRDIGTFRRYFADVETRWFWLTTLIIFILMAVLQRRNPNKERYWKKIVEEGKRWAWLYNPLERLDSILLRWLPFLRPLCWNVAILARRPKR